MHRAANLSVILFILGIVALLAGIVAIGFGIPINEFSLGNTLIVAGTTAVAAGLILIGLAAAVDQLNQIAKALRPRAPARPAAQPQAAPPQAVEQAFPGRQGQFPAPIQAPIPVQPSISGAGQIPMPGAAKPAMPAPPPRGPIFARPRVEEESAEVSFSAIERLRSSLARADRKAGDAQEAPYSAGTPAQATGPAPGAEASLDVAATGAGSNSTASAGGAGAAEAVKKPPLDFLFRSKSREPQSEPFDAVWPKRGPRRSDAPAEAGERAEPAAAEALMDRPSRSEPPPEESRPAAILKSGVVDGMAYTLYADGSIEAQLPQGTVRFGSIAELRSHIENNS